MESFKVCLGFLEKIVLCSSRKFYIFKPFTNVQSHTKFDLGFWQTSEQVYRKLQYGEKFFGKFQGLLHFTRKLVLYLLSKFSILKHCTNTQSLRRLELRFWQTSKQIYGTLQYKERLFLKFQSFPRCLKKMVLYSLRKFHIFEL